MSSITTQDGTQIYYKDWGTGEPVVFSHGWPLNADSWEAQMLFLATHGYRSLRAAISQGVCVPGRLPVTGGQPSELLAASQG
jgi:hypothetical protein